MWWQYLSRLYIDLADNNDRITYLLHDSEYSHLYYKNGVNKYSKPDSSYAKSSELLEKDQYHILYSVVLNIEAYNWWGRQEKLDRGNWEAILSKAVNKEFFYVRIHWAEDFSILKLIDFELGEDLVADDIYLGRSVALIFKGNHIMMPTALNRALTITEYYPNESYIENIMTRGYFIAAFEEEKRKKDFDIKLWKKFIRHERFDRFAERIVIESNNRSLKASTQIKNTPKY